MLSLRLIAFVASMMLAAPVRAEPRVEITASVCEEAAEGIERRISAILERDATDSLVASVKLEATADGIRSTVSMRESSAPRGESVLVVSSCAEAVDATVVMLSLAFGGETRSEDAPARAVQDAPRRVEGPRATETNVALLLTSPGPTRDASPASRDSNPPSRSTQLSLAGGADVGTLPQPAATVGAGVAYAWPALELRASLRYGLPTENERVENDLHESVRRDFGSAGLGICRGVGVSFRLTACTGGEVGFVRVAREREVDGGAALERSELSPRFSGVLATYFGVQRGRIRPELELAGSALAWGRREGAFPVAFRAAAGAAVVF